MLSIGRWTVGVSWWTTLPLLAVVFICSVSSYELIERPFRSRSSLSQSRAFCVAAAILVAAAGFVISLAHPALAERLTLVRKDQGIFQRGRQSQVNYIGPFTKRKNSDCGSPAEYLSQLAIRSSLRKCFWLGVNPGPNAPVVAILGDSHAHQLFPIAEEIAKSTGLSVYNYQYWGCLVPQDSSDLQAPKCKNVNSVPLWLSEEIKRPIIFVIASIADPVLHFPSEEDQRKKALAYRAAFEDVLRAGNYLIVVAPNPKFVDIENTISDICGGGFARINPLCSAQKEFKFIAEKQSSGRKTYLEVISDWARQDKRVVLINPFDILCNEKDGFCNAASNGKLNYWDSSHLNVDAVLSTLSLYKDAIAHLIRD